MITGNELATAIVKPGFLYGDGSYEEATAMGGLTIRQHFAAMAMQGILSDHTFVRPNNSEEIALCAVECADALIAGLNKPTHK